MCCCSYAVFTRCVLSKLKLYYLPVILCVTRPPVVEVALRVTRLMFEMYLQEFSCVFVYACLELQQRSRLMMVMDESRSLPERATELNWKLLLILPVTASESSLLEIDLSQGGLCGKKKAAISSWWEGMIRFVLSVFSFAGVSKSDQFSPVNTRSLLSSQS